MNIFFRDLFDCLKQRKSYFIILLFLSLTSIILGVVAAINFSGGLFVVDLSNIAYIRYLKGGGFMSMIFGLMLSLMVFVFVVIICNKKSFLAPLGLIFYLYLVYSQAVIITSIILIYGILNCLILAIILLIYTCIIWALFILILCEISCLDKKDNYFRCCFSFHKSKVALFLLLMLITTLIYAFILLILKSYVILLIF